MNNQPPPYGVCNAAHPAPPMKHSSGPPGFFHAMPQQPYNGGSMCDDANHDFLHGFHPVAPPNYACSPIMVAYNAPEERVIANFSTAEWNQFIGSGLVQQDIFNKQLQDLIHVNAAQIQLVASQSELIDSLKCELSASKQEQERTQKELDEAQTQHLAATEKSRLALDSSTKALADVELSQSRMMATHTNAQKKLSADKQWLTIEIGGLRGQVTALEAEVARLQQTIRQLRDAEEQRTASSCATSTALQIEEVSAQHEEQLEQLRTKLKQSNRERESAAKKQLSVREQLEAKVKSLQLSLDEAKTKSTEDLPDSVATVMELMNTYNVTLARFQQTQRENIDRINKLMEISRRALFAGPAPTFPSSGQAPPNSRAEGQEQPGATAEQPPTNAKTNFDANDILSLRSNFNQAQAASCVVELIAIKDQQIEDLEERNKTQFIFYIQAHHFLLEKVIQPDARIPASVKKEMDESLRRLCMLLTTPAVSSEDILAAADMCKVSIRSYSPADAKTTSKKKKEKNITKAQELRLKIKARHAAQ